MSPISDLRQALAVMEPILRTGSYVFLSRIDRSSAGWQPVMTFAEDEGLTLVVSREDAEAAGEPYQHEWAWITLSVHSALDGVGLTAAVSRALADEGISCNVVSAAVHDHLFVPIAAAGKSVAILTALAAEHRA